MSQFTEKYTERGSARQEGRRGFMSEGVSPSSSYREPLWRRSSPCSPGDSMAAPMRFSLVPMDMDADVCRSHRPTQSVSDPIPGMMMPALSSQIGGMSMKPLRSPYLSRSAESTKMPAAPMDMDTHQLDANHFARLLAPRAPEKSDAKIKREGIGSFMSYLEKSGRIGPNSDEKDNDVSAKQKSVQIQRTNGLSGKTIEIQEFEVGFPISLYNVFDLNVHLSRNAKKKTGQFIWKSIEDALISCNESGMSIDWVIEETRDTCHECNGRVYDPRRDSVDFQISLFKIRGDESVLMEIRRMSGAWIVHDEFVAIIVNALRESNPVFSRLEKHEREDESEEFWGEEDDEDVARNGMDFEMDRHMDDSSIISESLTNRDFSDMPELGESLPPAPLTSLSGAPTRFAGMGMGMGMGSSHSADECVQTLLDKDSYRDDLHECAMTLNGLTNDIGPARQVIVGLFAKHDGVQLCANLIESLLRPHFMDAHTSWHTSKAVSGLINHAFFPTLILVSKERIVESLIESVNQLKKKWTHGAEFVMPSQSIVNECDGILRKINQMVRSIQESS